MMYFQDGIYLFVDHLFVDYLQNSIKANLIL